MSTYRIYVDSRERQNKANSTDTDFTFALPNPITVAHQSLANVDVVCVPNSIRTVTEGLNDGIYMYETSSFAVGAWRRAVIAPGYYSAHTFADAIKAALNQSYKLLHADYTVVYNPIKNRYEISNIMQVSGESFIIYTEQSFPDRVEHPNPWATGHWNTGAWRQMGFVTGNELSAAQSMGTHTITGPDAPQLQYNTQLFLKSNLGIPATSVGPKGNQSIIRRIVLDAPVLGLVVDRHSTAFDAITIPPWNHK